MVINFWTITAFINFLSSLILAIFVILKNRKDQKNISFFALAVPVSLWSLSYFFWQNVTDNPGLALLWCRIMMAFSILITPAVVYFWIVTAQQIKEKKNILIFIYTVSLLFLIADLTPYFINTVRPIGGFAYWPVATPLFSIYVLFFAGCIVYGSLILIKKFNISSGTSRLQLKYIFLGNIISLISGFTSYPLWYGILIPPVGQVLVPVYIIIIAYAITRYRFMDVKIITGAILFYFGLAGLSYVFFYAVAFLNTLLFGGIFTTGSYLLGLFIAPVFAILIYTGSNFFSQFINKYIFYSLSDYQQAVKQISFELSHYVALAAIADIVSQTLQKTLQPEGVAFFFAQAPSFMQMSASAATTNPHPQKFFKALSLFGFPPALATNMYWLVFESYFKDTNKILIKDELLEIIATEANQDTKAMLQDLKNQLESNHIFVCIPLLNSGVFSGAIFIGDTKTKDSYTQEDFSLIEILSHQTQAAIDNTMLYQKIEEKNKSLEFALNAKKDFIRIANHQLNTPLSIMKNAYVMVQDGSISPQKGVEYWGSGLKRMLSVVEDFWDAFQSEGEIRSNIQKNDIAKAIKEAVGERKKILSLSNNQALKVIVQKVSFLIPWVWCDLGQLRRVIENLLDNAVFYTKKGTVKIIYELTADNKQLKVSIQDTGIGFSLEDKKKLAQRFYRSKNAMLNHPDGSGLGLYISKNIIENNGGSFFYDSPGEGRGSTFGFVLPVAQQEALKQGN